MASGILAAIYKLVAPTLTDKDTSPLLADVNGNLKVVASGTPSAALSEYVDDGTGFTIGTSRATAIGGVVDDTATDTADEGDFAVARFSSRRAQMASLDTLLAGEDQTNNVLICEDGRYSVTLCTADTQVKASAGRVKGYVVLPSGVVTAGVATLYDNTAESGTAPSSIYVPVGFPGIYIPVERNFATGIYLGYDATLAGVKIAVIWR